MSKQITVTIDDETYEALTRAAGDERGVAGLIAQVARSLRLRPGNTSPERQQIEIPGYEELVARIINRGPGDGWFLDESNPFDPDD